MRNLLIWHGAIEFLFLFYVVVIDKKVPFLATVKNLCLTRSRSFLNAVALLSLVDCESWRSLKPAVGYPCAESTKMEAYMLQIGELESFPFVELAIEVVIIQVRYDFPPMIIYVNRTTPDSFQSLGKFLKLSHLMTVRTLVVT